MLRVRELAAFYGASQALFGMELAVDAGEVVTLMGRNGMGKTTTVNAIMGLLPARRGIVEFEGQRVDHLPSFRIARLGLGLVPEGRQIFPNLSVRENLVAAAANRTARANPWTLDARLRLLPAARRAPAQHGQPALRRRAADAGDRPGADDQPQAADPRRGDRGAGAADPPGDLVLPRHG